MAEGRDRLQGLQALRRAERARAEAELARAGDARRSAARQLELTRATLQTQRQQQAEADDAAAEGASPSGELCGLELQRTAAFARRQSLRSRELEQAVAVAEQTLALRQAELDAARTRLGEALGREQAVEQSRQRATAEARKRAEHADE